MVSKIFLVSCVAKKRPSKAPAAELYTSAWFVKARAIVERSDAPWFILSAEHGLVDPHTVIPPYNRTLNTMGVADRSAWAARVIGQFETLMPKAEEVIVFAGDRYRQNLMGWLNRHYEKVTVPMAGMRIGQQLRWLTHAQTY